MLKIADHDDERIGGSVMQWWNGEGAARVLARDGVAVLLERAEGPASLAVMSRTGRDDEACAILCTVAARLHGHRSNPPPDLLPLVQWFRDLEPAVAKHGGILTKSAEAARMLLPNRAMSAFCMATCTIIMCWISVSAGGLLSIDRKSVV